MKCYEHYFSLRFEISGSNLTVENTNNLLKKFREKLDSFEVDNPPLKANVVQSDDILFEGCQQIHNGLVKGSYSGIKMNIADDAPEPLATDRFNNTVRAEIAQNLGAIELKHYNTILKVISVGYR